MTKFPSLRHISINVDYDLSVWLDALDQDQPYLRYTKSLLALVALPLKTVKISLSLRSVYYYGRGLQQDARDRLVEQTVERGQAWAKRMEATILHRDIDEDKGEA